VNLPVWLLVLKVTAPVAPAPWNATVAVQVVTESFEVGEGEQFTAVEVAVSGWLDTTKVKLPELGSLF
jgi:hypothetical protein